jgi:hypothetical protein
LVRVLKEKVGRADLTMARVCAKSGLRPLLSTSIRMDVCVDVCGAHCVGALWMKALIAQREIVLDDYWRKMVSLMSVSR